MTTSKPRLRGFGDGALRARDRIHLRPPDRARAPTPSAPTTFSCWMAAGRLTSVDTSSGWRPCFVSHFASLPAVVVLPAPCRPEQQDDARPLARRLEPAFGVAEERHHLVADDLDDLLRRRQAAQHVLPHRPVAHAVDERLDDLEVDVRFEQREPNLAQRRLDRSRASAASRRAAS